GSPSASSTGSPPIARRPSAAPRSPACAERARPEAPAPAPRSRAARRGAPLGAATPCKAGRGADNGGAPALRATPPSAASARACSSLQFRGAREARTGSRAGAPSRLTAASLRHQRPHLGVDRLGHTPAAPEGPQLAAQRLGAGEGLAPGRVGQLAGARLPAHQEIPDGADADGIESFDLARRKRITRALREAPDHSLPLTELL